MTRKEDEDTLAIEKMKLVRVDGLLKNLDSVIYNCCLDGNFHPEPAIQHMSGSLGYITLSEDNPYTSHVQKMEELYQLVGESTPPLKAQTTRGIQPEDKDKIQELADRLAQLQGEKADLEKQKSELEEKKAQFSHFTGLDMPFDEIIKGEYIKVRFGFLPKASYARMMVAYAENPHVLFVTCSEDKGGYWGIYFTPLRNADEIDGIFATLFFERLHLPEASGTPESIVKQLGEEINDCQKKIEQKEEEITRCWAEQKEGCSETYQQLKWHEEAFDLRHYAAYRDNYFFLVGWVPAAKADAFAEKVKQIRHMRVTISDPEEVENATPPTKLKNPWFVKPFEFFVDMYGLPSYGEMDITAFVAITFTVLFGIMFGDLGQGAVLAVGGFILWKWKKMALARLIVPCGISSMVFGFMFGSVFGFEEALEPVYEALGMSGKPISNWPGAPTTVLDTAAINPILVCAIFIGVALVLAAMVLHIIAALHKGQWGEAIFSNNGLVGILVYCGGVSFVSDFMSGPHFLPSGVAFALIGGGLVLLFFKEILIGLVDHHPNWKPESWADYCMQNIFELLEYVLSYFSNTVSFLRVGAFVFVHAAMMMAIFSLAGDPVNPVVVILGNALIIALEGLLSGIQGLRLEFYEMFSRCYEGGGHPFKGVSLTDKAA